MLTQQTKPNNKLDNQDFDIEAYLWQELRNRRGVTESNLTTFQSGLKEDSDARLFGTRVLEIISSPIVYQNYPNLWTQGFLNVKTDLPIVHFKETIPYVSFTGKPKFVSGVSDGIPMVSYIFDQQSHRVAIFELGMRVEFLALETIAFAKQSQLFYKAFDVIGEQLKAVQRGLTEFEHYTLCYGNSEHQLNGILNHPDIPVINAVGTFNPYTQTDASVLHNWFILTLLEALQTNTNENIVVNGVLIPTKLQNKLNTTLVPNTGITAMDLIQKSLAQMNIMAITEVNTTYLERYGLKAVGDNEHRLVIGEFSDDTVDCRVSDFKFFPWSQQTKWMEQLVQKAIRSVIVKKPNKLLYVDFANA